MSESTLENLSLSFSRNYGSIGYDHGWNVAHSPFDNGISIVGSQAKQINGQKDFWTINSEGKIFFREEYPFNHKHSIRATYIRGSSRVPAAIHEAATKLVAAEILVTDDNTILIAETGSNIDLAKKHEILTTEANAILDGKRNLVHLID